MPVNDPDCYQCPFYNGLCDECNCPENDSCPDIEESKANIEWLDNREEGFDNNE